MGLTYFIELNVDSPRHERLIALNRARDHGLDVEAVAFSTASLIAREELKVCSLSRLVVTASF